MREKFSLTCLSAIYGNEEYLYVFEFDKFESFRFVLAGKKDSGTIVSLEKSELLSQVGDIL